MYFTENDYDVFTENKSSKMGEDIQTKRKELQRKLIEIHEKIYTDVKALGFRCHEMPRHLTTRINPDKYHGKVPSWILVRYGKTPDEIEPYKMIDFGFLKHACIQFGIFEHKGFEISLFLGRSDYWDRHEKRLFNNLDKRKSVIENEINKLKNYGATWEISGFGSFDLDKKDSVDFCDWLKSNDHKGEESFLSIKYKHDDEKLSKENIHKEVLSKITLLKDLYNMLAR